VARQIGDAVMDDRIADGAGISDPLDRHGKTLILRGYAEKSAG
jgi:hypothetical protein